MKPSAFKLVVKIPSYTPDNCLNEDDISDVKIEALYRAERCVQDPRVSATGDRDPAADVSKDRSRGVEEARNKTLSRQD